MKCPFCGFLESKVISDNGNTYSLKGFTRAKGFILKALLLFFFIGYYGSSIYFTQDKILSINALGLFGDFEKYNWICWIACTIVEGVFVFIGYKVASKSFDSDFVVRGLILTVAFVIALVPITQITKSIMHRPRFRTIDSIPGSLFLNWWEPFKEYKSLLETLGSTYPNLSEHFKSLPSGHTGEAAMLMFGLPYIATTTEKFKNKENLMFIIGFIFTLLMAFSRMSMGAHYLSDVSFGALILIICSIIANEINLKFSKKIKIFQSLDDTQKK